MKKINNYSPLRYPGGKNKIYDYVRHIVSENGSTTYIEPYCGGAAVALKLLINRDVDRIILNDFDRSIYALWYSILYHPEELVLLVQNAKFSVAEWNRQREIQKNKFKVDLLSLGFSTLYLNRTNRSGIINAGLIGGKNQNGVYTMDCRFNKQVIIEKIKVINSKKSKIKLYNKDALVFIKENISKTQNAFIFFDPPYFIKGKKLYTNFYEPIDHIELERSIQKYLSKKKWIVTYDVTPEIKKIYNEYEHYEYYLNYSVANSRKGKEYIFFSDYTSSSKIESFLSLN